MCGNRLYDWNTIPIRRRRRSRWTPSAVISAPSTKIRPASIGSSKLMQRRSVDLPDPDAPMRQTTSCSATTRSIPRRTSFGPNDLWSPSMRSASAVIGRRLRSFGDRHDDEDQRDADERREVERRGLLDLRGAKDLDDADVRHEDRVLLEPDEV